MPSLIPPILNRIKGDLYDLIIIITQVYKGCQNMTINSVLTTVGDVSTDGTFLKAVYFIDRSTDFEGTVVLQVFNDETNNWYNVRGAIGLIRFTSSSRDRYTDRLAEFDYAVRYRFMLESKSSDRTTSVRVVMK